jgi:O-antigen ligase
VRAGAATLGAAALAGLGGVALAPLGTAALYALVAATAGGVAVWAVRDQLAPPLAEAVARVHPRRFAPAPTDRAVTPRAPVAVGAAAAAGVAAWLLATQGTKAALGLVGLIGAAVALWLLFPLAHQLLTTPPTDLPADPPARAPRPVRSPPLGRPPATPVRARRAAPPAARLAGGAVVALGAGVLAAGVAQLGVKGMVAVVGALAVAALLAVARDRSTVFMYAAVSSLTVVLHKSLSAQDLTLSGGAISVYVTTFDAVLLVLYGLWIAEGTFAADVRAAARRPILALPLVAALGLLPSLLVAPSTGHGVAELFRMVWMYLLFFYVAVRVRTRRHVWVVLAGLATFAAVELVVVVLQWRTGGVLGLSFLGVPTALGERVTDTRVIGRPFGTIIHPVFMGAVMGSLGLVALAVGLELRRSLVKTAALGFTLVCLVPLYLAHTRASLVAFVVVAAILVGVALARGHLRWATIGRAALGLVVVVALFLPQLSEKFLDNFSTAHFTEEIDSRRELNDIAVEIIDDHPVIGIGLNNFELVMPRYERYRVIFFNNPVHNLYLLYLAETGIVGFAGVVALGVGLLRVAIRLGRSPDRLLGGVGLGVAAAMGFLIVEELLGFSLRQDIPLAVYWLLAGLAVSCSRLAGTDGRRRRDPAGAPPAGRR